MTVNDIFEALKQLKMTEVAELVKRLEDEFGVSASAPMGFAMAAPAAEAAAPKEEKTKFDVFLVSGGDKKIDVIKAVRQLVSGLGLKEAKDLVESGNKIVLEGVSKEESDKAKKTLEEAGAKVEIK